MMGSRKVAVIVLSIVALAGSGTAVAKETAADEASIRGINDAWIKAYNAVDADALVALYAEDAVLNPPGAPAARGHAAMREFIKKDAGAMAASGTTLSLDPARDHGISGDLAWEWGRFKATDKSGATVDVGKYVTVYRKTNGKWLIIRDIWNSDQPAAAAAPAAAMPGKK